MLACGVMSLFAPGALQVPLEVEEEAHAPIAKEAPQDAPALQVKAGRLACAISFCSVAVPTVLQRASGGNGTLLRRSSA